MILEIREEILILVQALMTGNVLCLVYTVFTLLRKLVKHKKFWVGLEDLLFWLFAMIFVFAKIQKICSGNIRWYFVLGLLGGSFITHKITRKIVGKCIDKSKKTE